MQLKALAVGKSGRGCPKRKLLSQPQWKISARMSPEVNGSFGRHDVQQPQSNQTLLLFPETGFCNTIPTPCLQLPEVLRKQSSFKRHNMEM
ncbi:hypothetical protein PoB_000731900 [Plakobranchus ocellatus]|uniref:Uncharacterized protein n=1 Tax=Plakobranchus ocellatus TaxID=259542 RepID=A0AAV3YFJ0_9GAST|nr:hypothetical protein PoB_000731900 [Plakobranchus ocellatus]